MTSFHAQIRPLVRAELEAAGAAEARGEFYTAFQHLERAHVLGQQSTIEHVRVHVRMFRFSVRNGIASEAFGQAWRILAAAVFTPLGLVPEGNTGSASVSGLRRMRVPQDLRTQLALARAGARQRNPGPRSRFALVAVSALAALGIGCAAPADLDLSLDKPSAEGAYRVALVPPASAPAINQMHSWKVLLSTPDGKPASGARFAVDGGMPQHGHGLPTQPRVTREVEAGVYQIDGMKFSMTGWWEVKLAIDGAAGRDRVTFNTVVNHPPVRP